MNSKMKIGLGKLYIFLYPVRFMKMTFAASLLKLYILLVSKYHQLLVTFGLSRVRALPLAAGINVGGHYFWYYSTLVVVVLTTVVKIPEGVVVGFQIFAWAPN